MTGYRGVGSDITERRTAQALIEERNTALMSFNHSELPWDGRKRHPSTDPLNAMLSLTYTLLMHELTALLEGAGLDPYLGFLHQPDYGRPSLALDIVENLESALDGFRAIVEKLKNK